MKLKKEKISELIKKKGGRCMTLLIFLGSLLVGLAIGLPIAFSLLFSSVVLMIFKDMFDSQILAQNLIEGANNFPLMAIPFFILAGEFINASGMSNRIVNFAMSLVGHLRGGLGYVTILAGVLFAGISGSAIADTAALGAILIPMMVARGYDEKYSTGVVASSGIIATVFPPSIALILFGVVGGVSITKLFMGGIIPGILMALGLFIAWYFVSKLDKSELPARKSFKEIISAMKEAVWALLLPIIIIGGLRGGIFTPTEAAVVVAVYSLFIGVVIYKELSPKKIYESLISAGKTTSVVLFIVAVAMVSAWLITVANIPQDVIGLLNPLIDHPIILLLMINLLFLLVGMVMDIAPAILIFTPMLLPLVTAAGIDPIYFGIIVVINLSIGLITPPVGTVLYVAGGVSNIGITNVVKGVWPFLVAHLLVLLLLILFPQIITVPLELFG